MVNDSRFLFVGERPSPKAHAMGVAWADGRLAAKQLFDALRVARIDLKDCKFDNLFLPDHCGPEVVSPNAVRRIRYNARRGLTVVAMGRKVCHELTRRGVAHVSIVHPAARGRIRKKSLYAEHLQSILGEYTGK